ncbi:type II toxin-antitoxin system HicB family antitoxin [Lacticaseibacillus zhaodongensis]|uniref:type II toxin-antitoxin system HicB family antitoxin n=1 Tax=Lacticaseibacillus zhaodongensis TaxID=2668065 RepID=UPI0012D2E7B4|nr:type II toxin-antitoxin system HicB family antitoxin [Lacticaseibacillus zhaodongensis]
MQIAYPAMFYYTNSQATRYYVFFPDFGSTGTQGSSVTDALFMAADWLGIMAAARIQQGHRLPTASNINRLSLQGDAPFRDDQELQSGCDFSQSFTSMVTVDLDQYLAGDDTLQKTVVIPRWAERAGAELQLDFAKVLTEAIGIKNNATR